MAKHKLGTPVKQPLHLGKHVGATLDFIRASGGTGALVTLTGGDHLRFQFEYKTRQCRFTTSGTPRNGDVCARIARSLVRRAIRQAGVPEG